jgi:hypothetical protein|tara:strand:- start:3718 stop:3987 length:270 start_codon:yes stop_codon:yes gene_type:complete
MKHNLNGITNHTIHDFLEAWGDELATAGLVINEYGQIVLYTGARINKDTGEFEYGNFQDPCDPEAYIPTNVRPFARRGPRDWHGRQRRG